MATRKSYKDKSSNKKIRGCKLFTSFVSCLPTPKLLPNHTHSNIHQYQSLYQQRSIYNLRETYDISDQKKRQQKAQQFTQYIYHMNPFCLFILKGPAYMSYSNLFPFHPALPCLQPSLPLLPHHSSFPVTPTSVAANLTGQSSQ